MKPTVLSNTEKEETDLWLHDLQVWQCVTDLEKKQQGPVIYLSLPDKVRRACRDISEANLNKNKRNDKRFNNRCYSLFFE